MTGLGYFATNALLRSTAISEKLRAGRNVAVMPWRRQSCPKTAKGRFCAQQGCPEGASPRRLAAAPIRPPIRPYGPLGPGPKAEAEGARTDLTPYPPSGR